MSPVPAAPSTPGSTENNRPVRGARSCTLCRQMKARCNATELFPKPCTRCAHLGKEPCVIEPSFRRVNKRARIAEIQNELEQLKNTVKQQRSHSFGSRASSEFSDGQRPFLAPESTIYSSGEGQYNSYTRPEDPYRPVGLTGRIDSNAEDELFLTFFTKFHPTLPIVENTLTPEETFNACPLLYQTILLLATLATPAHPLTWTLRQAVNAAAPHHVLSSQKSVKLVQAFLLLATWPQTYPQGNNVNDQAWMYASVATHMAQCIGIHRSILASEYTQNQSETSEDIRREWVRTWVGCFIVGQFLSTALGVNPIIAEDFTIQNAPALLSTATPSSYDATLSILLDKLKMARLGCRITGLLSSCPNSSSGLAEVGDNLAIFRILQGDVQEVEASLLNTDEARGLSFLWVKLQLYSYALYDGMLPMSARIEFVLRGFETSFHFLEAFSAAVANGPLGLLPVLHPFSAVCSWVYVLKTLYSKYRMYLDVAATEKTLVDMQTLMATKSVTHGDFCSRAATYMETLLKDAKASEHNLGEPSLGVRSRMAAGLYFDGLIRQTDLIRSHGTTANTIFESKVLLTSPPSIPISSLTSSPFQSSDDLSTPPTTLLPPPAFPAEKRMLTEFWRESQIVEGSIISESVKVDMEWLADSFLTGEGGVAPSDLESYVAPGLLMVQ